MAGFPVMPVFLSVFLSSGACAQGAQPTLFGKADFEMEWQLQPQAKLLRVQFLAEKRRLRIEMLDGSDQAMIRDLASGKVAVLVANGTKGAYGSMARPMGAFRPEAVGEVREIIDNKCRDFRFQSRLLCITDDGIPLEVDLGGARLTATRLLRKSQLPALFEVPKELVLKPVPGSTAGPLPSIPF
jgi:hypothetical protein